MDLSYIESQIKLAAFRYYRLVIIAGPPGSGKTETLKELSDKTGFPYINLGLEASERLLQISNKMRPLRIGQIVQDIVNEANSAVVILDNIELLFEPSLKQDPLPLLELLSKNHTVVAAWNGTYRDGVLVYGEPGHPEYRKYQQADALVVSEENGTLKE